VSGTGRKKRSKRRFREEIESVLYEGVLARKSEAGGKANRGIEGKGREKRTGETDIVE